MRYLLSLSLVTMLVVACKKDKVPFTYVFRSHDSLYVESTMRVDTIDFRIPRGVPSNEWQHLFIFNSRPYMDPSQNPVYPVIHSSIYKYSFKTDSIYLRSMLSSYSGHTSYAFEWGAGKKSFTIKRFYNRRSLPDQLTFVQVK